MKVVSTKSIPQLDESPMKTSRRKFLKGALLGAVGLSVTSVKAKALPIGLKELPKEPKPGSWVKNRENSYHYHTLDGRVVLLYTLDIDNDGVVRYDVAHGLQSMLWLIVIDPHLSHINTFTVPLYTSFPKALKDAKQYTETLAKWTWMRGE
jgi:hypothetical protein